MFGMVLACQEVNGYSHVVRSNIIHFMKAKNTRYKEVKRYLS